QDFPAAFFNQNRRPKGKHTVIETTTERRTPDGLLLSTSHSRNIFYGDHPNSFQHDAVALSPVARRRHETPIHDRGRSPYRRPRSETLIREEMYSRTKEFSPERRTRIATPEVRNVPITRNFNDDYRRSETRATFREDVDIRREEKRREEDEWRRTERKEEEDIYIDPAQLYGNSTIYGDDWSQRGSVCKQSHLVRQSEGLSTELILVLNRLNDLRIVKGLRPLVVDCALMREAELLIREICLTGEICSAHPTRRLSLWKGDRLHSAIADLWTHHTPPTTPHDRFDPTRDSSLSVAGLASGYAHEQQKFVVVA
ncbi:hypothetical protein PENTCL1PPCAC_27837, partial [Pristionchus entomophagus]